MGTSGSATGVDGRGGREKAAGWVGITFWAGAVVVDGRTGTSVGVSAGCASVGEAVVGAACGVEAESGLWTASCRAVDGP